MREVGAALGHLDEAVTDAGGIALRDGAFYGADNDGLLDPVRRRQFPIIGDGGGFFSWIHLEDAATATALAVEHDGPGVYNIVDDEPSRVRECCRCWPTSSAPSRPGAFLGGSRS
jgi:NAD dependent epimerase/dehydratase family enzyme